MPWGWECRAKYIKQVPLKPIETKKSTKSSVSPGPNQYDTPQIFGGNGFSNIKRAPAYSFGIRKQLLPIINTVTRPNAPQFNIRNYGRRGYANVTHGAIGTRLEPPSDLSKFPGPAKYNPQDNTRKRPPAYSMRIAAKPPYQSEDYWTPPANMYLPNLPFKKAPVYSLGAAVSHSKGKSFPGPSDYEINFQVSKKNSPAFSFGTVAHKTKPEITPAPNAYCVKKLMASKPFAPAPSFGIRHSQYCGKPEVYMKTSKLNLVVATN